MRSNFHIVSTVIALCCLMCLAQISRSDEVENRLEIAQELVSHIKNDDISFQEHAGAILFFVDKPTGESSYLSGIISAINADINTIERLARRGELEKAREYERSLDPLWMLNWPKQQERLALMLEKQLRDEDKWVAAHILLTRLYRIKVARLDTTDHTLWHYYWNGLNVTYERVRGTPENRLPSRIVYPNPAEQQTFLIEQWARYLHFDEVETPLSAPRPARIK